MNKRDLSLGWVSDPESKVGWTSVGPTWVLPSRRWPNVNLIYTDVWGGMSCITIATWPTFLYRNPLIQKGLSQNLLMGNSPGLWIVDAKAKSAKLKRPENRNWTCINAYDLQKNEISTDCNNWCVKNGNRICNGWITKHEIIKCRLSAWLFTSSVSQERHI